MALWKTGDEQKEGWDPEVKETKWSILEWRLQVHQRVRAAQRGLSEVSMVENRSGIWHLDQKGAAEPTQSGDGMGFLWTHLS